MQEKGSLVKCSPGKGAARPSSRMYTKRLYCLPLQRQDDCQSLPNQPIADAIKLFFSSLLMERQNNLAFVIFESLIFVRKAEEPTRVEHIVGSKSRIRHTSFSSLLTIGPYKQECLTLTSLSSPE
jgi:hypothetical protein